MADNVLHVDDITVEVNDMIILKGVSFEINCGETHVLFGPNGSGKSTLLRAIMGFSQYKVIKGHILFKGIDITELSLPERAQMGIGISFQEAPQMTGVKLRQLLKSVSYTHLTLPTN